MSNRIGFSGSKGYYAGDGTSLGIRKDANGVLKIGDYVIPQRKILAEIGDEGVAVGSSIDLAETINDGDVIEIENHITGETYSQSYIIVKTKVSLGRIYGGNSTYYDNAFKVSFSVANVRETSAVYSSFSPVTYMFQVNGTSLLLVYSNRIYSIWDDGDESWSPNFNTSGTTCRIRKITKIIE